MRISFLAAIITLGWTAAAQPLPAGRAQDLEYVANQVPKLHANFFFRLPPGAFQQAVTNLQANGASMSNAEFYVALANLVAMAGDEHTALYLFSFSAGSAGFQEFPLTFRWLDDGVFVTGAAPQYSRALGTQLVEVGGNPIGEVVRRLGTIIPHSSDQWLHFNVARYLRVQQVLQGLKLAPAAPTTAMTLQTGAGQRFTLEVAPGPGTQSIAPDPANGPAADYLQNAGRNYWFRYSAANRLLYFKYNVCANDPANPMDQFTASFLAALDANPVDTVVFDLRGNAGGNGSVILPLAFGLVGRLPALAANPNFRFYDVIDKGTFSSGLDIAMGLKAPVPAESGLNIDLPKLTTVIGEGTGGPTEGYGEVIGFRLPGSGIAGQYSTQFHSAPAGIQPAPSFLPDVAIGTRSTDYFARHDPVLAAILGRSNGAPAAPSGDAIVVNGASFRVDQGVAPGSIAAVFGNFTVAPDQVLLDDAPGQMIGGNQFQANFLVPPSVAAGMRPVSVRAAGKELAAGKVTITPAGPGIFVLSADPTQPGAVLNQDYVVNAAERAADAGSVIQIFATGSSPADASPAVRVYAAGAPAEVLYSGPSGYPGLWQINAKLPAGISGQVPVFLTSQSFVSNAVTVWVR